MYTLTFTDFDLISMILLIPFTNATTFICKKSIKTKLLNNNSNLKNVYIYSCKILIYILIAARWTDDLGWMRAAQVRDGWRWLRVAYVQQWTAIGWWMNDWKRFLSIKKISRLSLPPNQQNILLLSFAYFVYFKSVQYILEVFHQC